MLRRNPKNFANFHRYVESLRKMYARYFKFQLFAAFLPEFYRDPWITKKSRMLRKFANTEILQNPDVLQEVSKSRLTWSEAQLLHKY